MGIYWATYLCIGKFTSQNIATVTKRIKVASINPMIEPHEWKAGFVALPEIQRLANKWNIQLQDDSKTDLFMQESESTTYDLPLVKSTDKFILVKGGVKFIQKEEEEKKSS